MRPAASAGSKVASLATQGLFLLSPLSEHTVTFHLKQRADWSAGVGGFFFPPPSAGGRSLWSSQGGMEGRAEGRAEPVRLTRNKDYLIGKEIKRKVEKKPETTGQVEAACARLCVHVHRRGFNYAPPPSSSSWNVPNGSSKTQNHPRTYFPAALKPSHSRHDAAVCANGRDSFRLFSAQLARRKQANKLTAGR